MGDRWAEARLALEHEGGKDTACPYWLSEALDAIEERDREIERLKNAAKAIVSVNDEALRVRNAEIDRLRGLVDDARIEKALELIAGYGGIDGGHHKQWVLDQVVRLLADDYAAWIAEYQGEWDEEWDCWEHEWEEGIAP